MRLAIVATHPIQYQVPWFRALAAHPGVHLKVYYAILPNQDQQGVGFGTSFQWDLPLLEGYDWEAIANVRSSPSLDRFFGLSSPGIYSALKRDRPDALIITGWNSFPLLQALWAGMRLGIPRIVRGESNSLRARPLPVRILHRALLSMFDGYLAIGESNRTFYLSNGIRADRIFMTRYFVDNDRFASQQLQLEGQRDCLRAEWAVPPGHTCFLFAGKLIPKKRPIDLLDALHLVVGRAESAVHLLVVGAGELLDDARSRAESLRLPVTFAGFLNQTEMSRAYIAADCLVLPSDHGETWGLVVNEAMASGRAAIVSDRVGCGPDLVEEGVTGYVFPYGDVNALAARMSEVAGDADALHRMGARARGKIAEYSIERAVEGTICAAEYAIGCRKDAPHTERHGDTQQGATQMNETNL